MDALDARVQGSPGVLDEVEIEVWGNTADGG